MDNSLQALGNYQLIKWEANSILLQHKVTKAVYQYHQRNYQPIHEQIKYESIVFPIVFFKGILYPLGYSNLQKQLLKKMKCKKQYFSRQQIAWTFIPIIRSLEFLHKQNVVHGCLHLNAIIIDNNAQIKLLMTNRQSEQNQYYGFNKIKKPQDDRKALGFIIIQLSLLINFQELRQQSQNQLLEKVQLIYGSNFSKSLQMLMAQNQPNYQKIIDLFLAENHEQPKQNTNINKTDKIQDQSYWSPQKYKTTIIKHKNSLINSENKHLTQKFKIRTPNIKHRQDHSENKKKIQQNQHKTSRTVSKMPDVAIRNIQNPKLLKKRNGNPQLFKFQEYKIQFYSKNHLKPSMNRGIPTHCFNTKR